ERSAIGTVAAATGCRMPADHEGAGGGTACGDVQGRIRPLPPGRQAQPLGAEAEQRDEKQKEKNRLDHPPPIPNRDQCARSSSRASSSATISPVPGSPKRRRSGRRGWSRRKRTRAPNLSFIFGTR